MDRGGWFSGARLQSVPSADEVRDITTHVQAYWTSRGLSPCAPAEAFRLLGWEIRYRSLRTGRCRHRAMLVPMLSGGFVVLVDEVFARSAATEGRSELMSSVLAHELAHSFFYAATAPPERLLPLAPEEELFCDAFAAEVLTAHAAVA